MLGKVNLHLTNFKHNQQHSKEEVGEYQFELDSYLNDNIYLTNSDTISVGKFIQGSIQKVDIFFN